jgi:hypothetical protein
MQHWGWPSKTEAPNVRVAAARAVQTVGYLERGESFGFFFEQRVARSNELSKAGG